MTIFDDMKKNNILTALELLEPENSSGVYRYVRLDKGPGPRWVFGKIDKKFSELFDPTKRKALSAGYIRVELYAQPMFMVTLNSKAEELGLEPFPNDEAEILEHLQYYYRKREVNNVKISALAAAALLKMINAEQDVEFDQIEIIQLMNVRDQLVKLLESKDPVLGDATLGDQVDKSYADMYARFAAQDKVKETT